MVGHLLRIFTFFTVAILISGSTCPTNPYPVDSISSSAPIPASPRDKAGGSGILTIPLATAIPVIDGQCTEYAGALVAYYDDGNSTTGTIYLVHNGGYLYVCVTGQPGTYTERFASLYLDQAGDGSSYIYAQQDDYAFHTSLSGELSSYQGTDMPDGYILDPGLDQYVLTAANLTQFDGFEYRLDLQGLDFGYNCNLFGLAFYHHWFAFPKDDYGWPTNQYYDQPRTWQLLQLGGMRCDELPNGSLAYVYYGNTANAASFYNFLVSEGYSVSLVPLNKVLTTDFTAFDLIIIADDTGFTDKWGTSGQMEEQVAQILAANQPMIGLGEGGYAFNGQAGFFIGWPNGWHPPQDTMQQSGGPLDAIFFEGIPPGPVITYQVIETSVSIYLDLGYPQDVIPIGLEYPAGNHASLINQGCRLLWGNSGNPLDMTENGKAVFLNGLAYMITRQCSSPPTQQCVSVTKEAYPPDGTTVTPGTVIQYTLTATFSSDPRCIVPKATLIDSVPVGTLFVPASATDGISPIADGSLVWELTNSPTPVIKQFSVRVENSACMKQLVSNRATLQIPEVNPYSSNFANHQVTCQPLDLPHQQPDFAEEDISLDPYPLILGQPSAVRVRIRNLTAMAQPVHVDFQTSADRFGIGLEYTTFDHTSITVPAYGNVIAKGQLTPTASGQWGIQVVVTGPDLAQPLVTQSILDVTEALSPGTSDNLIFKVGNPTPATADIQLVVENRCSGWTALITSPTGGVLPGMAPGEVREATLQVTPPRPVVFGSGCHIEVQGWIGDDLIGGLRKLDVTPVHLPAGSQPSWEASGISFNPDPPVAGLPNQYCLQLQNPLDSTVPVSLEFSIADFGAGLDFTPVGSLDVTLPPNSLDDYCITWIPSAGDTAQRCALVTLHQAGSVDGKSQRNVQVVNVLPSELGALDIPFSTGNPDIVTHTLVITTTVFGLDPSWEVSIQPAPPASLMPGETIMLHLGFIKSGAPGSIIPAAGPAMGDYGRVEAGILLDDVLVGGFTVVLQANANYLPVVTK